MKTLLSIAAMLTLSVTLNAQSSEKRNLGAFNTIDVNTAATVNITQSDSDLVTVESKGDLHLVSTKVENGVLFIHSTGNVTCNVNVKSLKAIIARDAATVKSQNTLTVDDLKITQSDASTVSLDLNAKSIQAVTKDASTLKLSGTASTLDVSSSDASTVKAADLKAGIVTALAHDAARITTWAESKISARATDSGIVTYKGNPTEKNSSATDRGVVETDDGKMVAESKLESDSTDEDDTTDDGSIDHSFADGYLGFGYVLGPDQKGAFIKYGKSREFNFGFGGGYKFFKWNGIGADIYYKSTDFYLTQDSTKTLPNRALHNDEKIAFNNLGGLLFDRFFIGKMFLDGGIYYDWVFNSRHVTWDTYTTPNAAGATSTKVIDRNLSFAQPSDYGLQFRFGSQEGFCFYFNYRMADLIKQPGGSATGLPEVPKYVLGINIGGF